MLLWSRRWRWLMWPWSLLRRRSRRWRWLLSRWPCRRCTSATALLLNHIHRTGQGIELGSCQPRQYDTDVNQLWRPLPSIPTIRPDWRFGDAQKHRGFALVWIGVHGRRIKAMRRVCNSIGNVGRCDMSMARLQSLLVRFNSRLKVSRRQRNDPSGGQLWNQTER